MIRIFIIIIVMGSGFGLSAQSLTSKQLGEQYDASLNLFFYRNTLRMLNFNDDPDFDKMISGIEKLRFLMLDKAKNNFGTEQYSSLVKKYQQENYEEVMNVRHQDMNFNIFVKEDKGQPKAMLLLANAEDSIILLDMLGSVPLDKIGQLYGTVSEINGLGRRIVPKPEQESEKKSEQKTDH